MSTSHFIYSKWEVDELGINRCSLKPQDPKVLQQVVSIESLSFLHHTFVLLNLDLLFTTMIH